MRYSRLSWTHTSPTEPVEILSEYDQYGWERRKVEVFPDGSMGFAGHNESGGGSELALIPCPPDEEVIAAPEFRVSELTRAAFDAAWHRARQSLSGAVKMSIASTPIRFVRGDATAPEGDGPRIVAHVCNDIGAWGRGFVLALSRRWDQPEAAYREWHTAGAEAGFSLGGVQFVQVEPTLWVANMIGQHGIRRGKSGPPIRYEMVAECLARVADKAVELGASVHMPRIGCGLAGGDWSRVEQLVQSALSDRGVAVTVYDFD